MSSGTAGLWRNSMRKLVIASILIAVTSLTDCQSRELKYTGVINSGSWMRNIRVPYEVDGIKKHNTIQIYFPKNYSKQKGARTLIALHGYKGNLQQWEQHTSIESYADTYHFVIVCPDMGTTIYETKYYPETKNKWNGIPGGKWIAEILIPFLRDYFGIATNRFMTGIFGNSTGGRGAVLLSALYPDLFGAAAGLSGDYDPLSMPKDRLLTSVYGTFKKFKERWRNDDNIITRGENLVRTPVFIAHGEKDRVVPFEQSRILAIRLIQLRKKEGDFIVEYYLKRYRFHDWAFWRSMTPLIMSFFNKHLSADKTE